METKGKKVCGQCGQQGGQFSFSMPMPSVALPLPLPWHAPPVTLPSIFDILHPRVFLYLLTTIDSQRFIAKHVETCELCAGDNRGTHSVCGVIWALGMAFVPDTGQLISTDGSC